MAGYRRCALLVLPCLLALASAANWAAPGKDERYAQRGEDLERAGDDGDDDDLDLDTSRALAHARSTHPRIKRDARFAVRSHTFAPHSLALIAPRDLLCAP